MRSFAEIWPVITSMRGGAGESTVKESVTVSPVTKVWMQVWQSVFAGAGLFVVIAGLFLMCNAVLKAFDISSVDGGSLALGIAGFGCAGYFILKIAFVQDVSEVVARLLGVAGVLIGLALCVAMVFKFSSRLTWELAGFVVGAAFFYGGVLLVQNMSRQLIDPMGWTSPYERQTAPPTARMINAMADKMLDEIDGEDDDPPIIVEVHDESGRTQRITGTEKLGMSPAGLKTFAKEIMNGKPLRESYWGKRKDAFEDGRDQFIFARQVMLDSGWIEKDGNSFSATFVGKRVFKHLARL